MIGELLARLFCLCPRCGSRTFRVRSAVLGTYRACEGCAWRSDR